MIRPRFVNLQVEQILKHDRQWMQQGVVLGERPFRIEILCYRHARRFKSKDYCV